MDQRNIENMKMTYSAILRDKSGHKIVRVAFERRGEDQKIQIAEGVIPGGQIVSAPGFDEGEKLMLSKYLKDHTDEIMAMAKTISNPLKWL